MVTLEETEETKATEGTEDVLRIFGFVGFFGSLGFLPCSCICYYPSMSTRWDFHALPPVQPDPLFGIAAEAALAGSSAINGTLGIFMDENGKPALFPSTKLALDELGKKLSTLNYSYPPLSGLPEFRTAVTDLIFGPTHHLHIASIAATAGTGSLAMNLRLAKMMQPEATVILQHPAWANHPPICQANFLHITEVPYIVDGKPSVATLKQACEKANRPVILLLQVGCHNPTGLDFSMEQWQEIADLSVEKDCLVILDFAYQGFKSTPQEDRKPIDLFLKTQRPLLICWSASKNFSIYGMRCGFSCAVAPDEDIRAKLDVLYSRITRGMHSAAPTFGQMIVALVQQKYRDQWEKDLASAREMMLRKRQLLLEHLPETFHASLSGYGMFAMLPLTTQQVHSLKKDYKVFVASDGRLNIGGIPLNRIEELCERIEKVL